MRCRRGKVSSYTSFFRGCSRSSMFNGSTFFFAVSRARSADSPMAGTAIRMMGHSRSIISTYADAWPAEIRSTIPANKRCASWQVCSVSVKEVRTELPDPTSGTIHSPFYRFLSFSIVLLPHSMVYYTKISWPGGMHCV